MSGLRGVSVREALPAAVHLPEEEPQEEADGLLLVLHVREIPLRAAQLHRPARHGHPRKSCSQSALEREKLCESVTATVTAALLPLWPAGQAEADQAHHHLLPVLQRRLGDPAVHGRGRPRTGHPRGGLDRPVRPPGRPQGSRTVGAHPRPRRGQVCRNEISSAGCLVSPQEYIHRVGRTARGIDGRGHALLILRPEELGFLRFLKQAKVTPLLI